MRNFVAKPLKKFTCLNIYKTDISPEQKLVGIMPCSTCKNEGFEREKRKRALKGQTRVAEKIL
jgi:hypothetical protein